MIIMPIYKPAKASHVMPRAIVLAASVFLASNPMISCTQEKLPEKTAPVAKIPTQWVSTSMNRDYVINAFKNAKQNGKTFDNVEEAAKALKGKFDLLVIGNNINVYKDNKKIGVFVITGKPEVAILTIGDLLAIADRFAVALFQDTQHNIHHDCSSEPFEYKPKIGIRKHQGGLELVVASSTMGQQQPPVVTLLTNLPAASFKLNPDPQSSPMDPNDPGTYLDSASDISSFSRKKPINQH